MKWHPDGKYLALVIPVQHKKTKKTRSRVNQIEVLHMRLPGYPSDSLLIPSDQEKLNDIAFEPRGDRFAVLMTENIMFERNQTYFWNGARRRTCSVHRQFGYAGNCHQQGKCRGNVGRSKGSANFAGTTERDLNVVTSNSAIRIDLGLKPNFQQGATLHRIH